VKKPLVNLLVKPALILIVGVAMGLLFGILPCYLFPVFGADVRSWCGYKSEPPHFVLQFWLGFVLAAAVTAYLAYRKR